MTAVEEGGRPKDNPSGPPLYAHPFKGGGDRASEHHGLTGSTAIMYDAEVKKPTFCEGAWLRFCCLTIDTKRSYLYIRETSIEKNTAVRCCFNIQGCCKRDFVSVQYFDKAPFKRPTKTCGGFIPCCPDEYPRLEMYEPGYVCCGTNCRECGACCEVYYEQCDPDRVVVMPSEMCPAPCCCKTNRTSVLDNCCNICGPPVGRPKLFFPFSPQPKDPKAFVAAAQAQMMQRA